MVLSVEFTNGIIKTYDVKQLANKWEIFNDLTNEHLFKCVIVEAGGYGIKWNDDLDLACNELWYNGEFVIS